MAKSRYTIKTKELIIEPANVEDIWEGDWTIVLRGEKDIQIGTASFAGEKMYGTVPVYINLNEEYRNKDYGTEAFKLLVDFAFGYKNIYEVKATTDSENDKCIHALEKAGFVHRKTEHGISCFSVKKPKSTWLGLYVYIGLITGLILGIVLGSLWAGLIIGIVIGYMVGGYMDSQAQRNRIKITSQEESD